MEQLLGLKNHEQMEKKAYSLVDRGHTGSVDKHGFMAAYPFFISSNNPPLDYEAAEKAFAKADADRDGQVDRAEFSRWWSSMMNSVEIDELRSRLYHLSQFLDRKVPLKDVFHLYDQDTPNRILISDAKAIIKSVLPDLSDEQLKEMLSRMDPKKSGWITPLPFMHVIYWQTKKMSVSQLREAFQPIEAARRQHLLHSIFDAFDHEHKGSLGESEWTSFSHLDPKELSRTGKVKVIEDERKQPELITKIDDQFKKHKIARLTEKEFLPMMEEITEHMKATQLNKMAKGYRDAASGVGSSSEAKQNEEEEEEE